MVLKQPTLLSPFIFSLHPSLEVHRQITSQSWPNYHGAGKCRIKSFYSSFDSNQHQAVKLMPLF